MSWYTAHILSIITFLPLVGAVVIAFLGREKASAIRWTALIFSVLTFMITVCLYTRFDPQNIKIMQFEELSPWMVLPPVNYHLGVDGLSALMILLAGFLTPLSVLVSWSSITSRPTEFFIFLLALETGMMGVFASLDLVLFFVFWEVMLIPMYFLIGIWGHERRVYAAIKFVLFTMVGSALMLTGIIYLYNITGTFDLQGIMSHLGAFSPLSPTAERWLFLAFFIAFAIKVPIFPFHTWLPDAHVEAPTAGSVILAGVLLKMGTYGMLRFCLPLFPEASREFAPVICVLAIIGIIYGALVAMVQPEARGLFFRRPFGILRAGNFRVPAGGHRRRHLPDVQPRRFHGRPLHAGGNALRAASYAPDQRVWRPGHVGTHLQHLLPDCGFVLAGPSNAERLRGRVFDHCWLLLQPRGLCGLRFCRGGVGSGLPAVDVSARVLRRNYQREEPHPARLQLS
jgi:hypothetical protein